AQCSTHAYDDHRQRKANAKARHQDCAEGNAFELQTPQQTRHRRRARDEPTRESECDDLACRDMAVGEAAADVVGVLLRVGVRVLALYACQGGGMAVRVSVIMIMRVVMMMIVVMTVMMVMVVMAM